uniref:hypothetical protein n=1 Tax=Paractinoplanes polyasparticus TaxID=2856853 RepID=UPI001C842940|nr:hypothetical protein [Actinoplanes polyasparticus]
MFKRPFYAATMTVAALTMAATAVPASAAAAESTHGRLITTVTPERASTPEPITTAVRTLGAQQCTPTPAGSRERRAGGVAFCVRSSNDTATAWTTAKAAAGDALTCSVTGSNQMRYQRFESCLKITVSGTLVNSNGTPIGTATLNFVNSVTLNATSTAFDQQITATVSNTTGSVSQVAVSLTASCTSACRTTKANPWTGTALLSRGQSATGTVSHAETLAKNTQDSFRLRYNAFITVPNAIPAQPTASWDGTIDIRCDNAVTASPGCVYPTAIPDLQLSAGTYNAAAITYLWAQLYLPDSWGADTPLRRLASDSAANTNRSRTCEDGTFIHLPDPPIVDDSCDEFPFAKTYEGGTLGSFCADIAPILEDGQWQIYEANPNKPVTGNEPCVRGHVNLDDNEAAGGELGRFTQRVRLLDLDKYTLTITT